MKEIIFQEDREMDVVAIGRIGIDLNPNEYNRPLEDTLSFTKTVGGIAGEYSRSNLPLWYQNRFYRKDCRRCFWTIYCKLF